MPPHKADADSPDDPKNSKWFSYFLDRYGLPTAAICVLAWWLSGHVFDPLVKKHVEFLDAQIKVSENLTAAIKAQAEAAVKSTEIRGRQTVILEDLAKASGRSDEAHSRQIDSLGKLERAIPCAAPLPPSAPK